MKAPRAEDPTGSEEPASDGRRRRSQRTREHILRVLAETLADPKADVSPEQIAARSGYSVSTVLRLFRDQQGLLDAMRDLAQARAAAALDRGPFEGDRAARVEDLVSRLGALFETVGPFVRAMLRRRRTEEHATALQNIDRAVRAQTRDALAGELASSSGDDLEILSAALSYATWNHQRSIAGHDPERAAELMRATVLRILSSDSA